MESISISKRKIVGKGRYLTSYKNILSNMHFDKNEIEDGIISLEKSDEILNSEITTVEELNNKIQNHPDIILLKQQLKANEEKEIKIISELLPAVPTVEDVTNWILANYPEGIAKDKMGFVIKEMKIALPGVDGKMCADFVKKSLI